MKTVFADSSFYVALSNPDDAYHAPAVRFARAFRGHVLTTEYVLLELGNFLSRAADKPVFLELLEQLRSDPQTAIQWADCALFDQGLDLYTRRQDKNWSLTDCISFAVMTQHKMTEALTTDHHFRQAGFRVLLV